MERKKSDKSHVDVIIRVLACATVILVVACIAAAISYSHMCELAIRHGETGWRAHAFSLSIDGIERTASLVLLAHRPAPYAHVREHVQNGSPGILESSISLVYQLLTMAIKMSDSPVEARGEP